MKPMTAIDLCSGAGGWACAARGLPIHIKLAVDCWTPACKTYQLNYPQTKVMQADLRDAKVQAEVIAAAAGVDLIVGGIPCEWLSVYRNLTKVGREELDSQRATLDACLALVKQINPRYWCLEDVEQLEKELPPFTPFSKINARHYSPQRRKRIYVGDFPLPPLQRSQEMMASRLRRGPYRIGPRAADRTPQITRTFTNNAVLAAYPDRKSPTILCINSRRDADLVVVDDALPSGKRQLEWQECAGLQGFPDDYVFWGSPTDVSTMVGRAVQIDLGREILTAIVRDNQK